mgnify:CR=1 FL=1
MIIGVMKIGMMKKGVMKKETAKGYLTVFLALSLSAMTGFMLFLYSNAANNAAKIRLELATDMGMNSALGEYHRLLHDRYGLFFVDASFGEGNPSIENLENRIYDYTDRNLPGGGILGPYGKTILTQVQIEQAVSAAAGDGKCMKRQAVQYVKDMGWESKKLFADGDASQIETLLAQDAIAEWCDLMDRISAMELPKVQNADGEWEEVPLRNPADAAFGMMGSSLLYLTEIDAHEISDVHVKRSDYCSGRIRKNTLATAEFAPEDVSTKLFLTYLSEQMGCCGEKKEDGLLQYQLEYIACGEDSDYGNVSELLGKLLAVRFAVNLADIFSDSDICGEASALAQSLNVVKLAPVFADPVAQSILFACAYLESVSDVRCLVSGGRIPINKSSVDVRIEQVLRGEVPAGSSSSDGLNYKQYLLCFIALLPEKERNLRALDIMEMDIRKLEGTPFFCMDYCVERMAVTVWGKGAVGTDYDLRRTYGYY